MKVNDYARSSEGDFGKIVRINNSHDIELEYSWVSYDEEDLKSSPNIIDLIEKFDLVNGYLVYEIKENCVMVGYKCFKTKFDNEEDFLYQTIYEENIKSIITHEQIENMKYKVKE